MKLSKVLLYQLTATVSSYGCCTHSVSNLDKTNEKVDGVMPWLRCWKVQRRVRYSVSYQ